MRILMGIGAVVATAVLGGIIWLNTSPLGRIYLPSGTGIVAKQTCSLAFVSGLDADRARALYLDPLLGDVAGIVSTTVDYENGEVTASALGFLYTQRAVHREGLGCTLVHGDERFDRDATAPLSGQSDDMVLNGDAASAHFDMNAMNAAIEPFMKQDRER